MPRSTTAHPADQLERIVLAGDGRDFEQANSRSSRTSLDKLYAGYVAAKRAASVSRVAPPVFERLQRAENRGAGGNAHPGCGDLVPDCLVRSSEHPAAQASPLQVVRACLAAHRAEDWSALRRLFHPQAKIGVFAGGGSPGDPEKAITDMAAAHADELYHADVQNAQELDEFAVLLTGSVRYRSQTGGFIHVQRTWLYIVVDGLLYRSQVFAFADEAIAAYAAHGPNLGNE